MAFYELDDRQLDRLVDGELSSRERSELIASLDRCDQGWRRCALTFLEAQSWSAQFRELLDEGGSDRPVALAMATATPHRGAVATRTGWWLAIAAGLLASFGLGRLLAPVRGGDRGGSGVDARLSNQVAGVDVAPSVERDAHARAHPEVQPDAIDRPPRDALTLVLRGEAGELQRVRLPLVDSAELGIPVAEASTWSVPEPLRSSLRQRGWDLETRRRYAPLFIEQAGRLTPMVMSVDDTYVTPVVY